MAQKPIFFIIWLFSMHEIIAEILYLDEKFSGAFTNGSITFPYNNFSDIVDSSLKKSVDLVLLSDLNCNISFFNYFGMRIRFFHLDLFYVTYKKKYLYFRPIDPLFPLKILVKQCCLLISSNSSLSFQNLNIIFLKQLMDSPFKIFKRGLLSVEVT